jgi:ATP-binding cassette, subfamily B, multidrug efflux pump
MPTCERRSITIPAVFFHESLRLNTLFALTLILLNALLITGTGAFAIILWRHGHVGVGTVAMALPMTTQIISASHWVAWQVTDIFENVGVVQEGMMTIARPIALSDRPDARTLKIIHGEIRFEDIRFGYGRQSGLIDGLTLDVRPGEKIGLVGRSGAGKSMLVNLLLRFFDLAYPDRRTGHRRGFSGKPPHANLHGHSGYVSVASFNQRQYPLRSSGCERARNHCGSPDGPCA